MQEQGGHRAHVAKSLHGDPALMGTEAQFLHSGQRNGHDPASGGLAPSSRSSQHQGFACDDGRDRAPGVHGVGIHDPGHDLFVGVQIRSGDVRVRTEDVDQVGRISSGKTLNLPGAHLRGITPDRALGSAKGDIHNGTLPRHPRGQGLDLIEGNIWRVANTPLEGPRMSL